MDTLSHKPGFLRGTPAICSAGAIAACWFLLTSGSLLAEGEPGGQSTDLRVVIEGSSICAKTGEGKVLFTGRSGVDDADIVQRAIDQVHPGGEVRLLAGKYLFSKPVRLYNASTFSGAGKSTVIVPPADDYALLIRTEDKSPRRWYHDNVLNGVTLKALTIDGQRSDGSCQGKGIYLQNVFDSHLDGLWIANTGAGAGLFLEDWVGESNFTNIHLMNCGNVKRRQAAVVIHSSDARPCNNLQFRGLYIIFPPYRGLDIHSEGGSRPPKLIFISHSMFHGWIPKPGHDHETTAADLVYIESTDKERGIFFDQCRFTAADRQFALLKVINGSVAVTNSSIGPIGGRFAKAGIWAENGAKVRVVGNTFHEVDSEGESHLLYVKGAEVLFANNEISGKAARLSLLPGMNSIISSNIFELSDTQNPVILIGDDGKTGSKNIQVHGNVFGEGLPAEKAISVSALSKGALQPQ